MAMTKMQIVLLLTTGAMDALVTAGPLALPLKVLPPPLQAGLVVLLFPAWLIVMLVAAWLIVVVVLARLTPAVVAFLHLPIIVVLLITVVLISPSRWMRL